MTPDYIAAARQYEADVLSGAVPVCAWIRLAVERQQKDLARQDSPFIFDEKKAIRACRFAESMVHIQGPKAGTLLHLENWQCWYLTTLFGWVRKETGFRRFRRAYTECGRGNGKSLLAAIIGIYATFAEGEPGADSIATATCMEQAKLVLDTARAMVRKNKTLCKELGLQVLAHQLVKRDTDSRLRGMPAKGTSLEGVSLHLGIIDELAFHAGRAVYDSLSTATAKRSQSLLFCITTAGTDSSGVCWELRDFLERVLTGEAEDDSLFGVIFTTDSDDQWDTPEAWKKANPNLGVSIDVSVIQEECARARQVPSQRAGFRQRYLCEWQGATEENYLAPQAVRNCLDKTLEEKEFLGESCVMAADLASRLDLTSFVRVHQKTIDGKRHYYAFCKNWLPEETIVNSTNASYRGWIEQGWLQVTPGSVTDLDYIEKEVFQQCQQYKVRDFGFDQLQSNMLVTHLGKRLERDDLFIEIGQFVRNMTVGMHELSECVADGRLHTNNPVLTWALSNLQAKEVGMHMIFPCRPKDHAKKIDPAVALVMALRSTNMCPLDESERPPRVHFIDMHPQRSGPTEADLALQAKCEQSKKDAVQHQRDFAEKLKAIPPGEYLVCIDEKGNEIRRHRSIAYKYVVTGVWTLVRAES